MASLQRIYNEGTTTLLISKRRKIETFLTNFNTENTTTIYLVRKKMLFVFAKNGLYYQFLSNTTSEQKEVKLLHEYGLNLDDLSRIEEVEVCCPRL